MLGGKTTTTTKTRIKENDSFFKEIVSLVIASAVISGQNWHSKMAGDLLPLEPCLSPRARCSFFSMV